MSTKSATAPLQAALSIDFLVIGGGIAGLACALALRRVGHQVQVLEKTDGSSCAARGDGGLRLPPNVTKILYHWGLKDKLQRIGLVSYPMLFSRYESGDYLGLQMWDSEMLKETRGEYLLLTHDQLHQLLSEAAAAAGVRIRTNAEVVDINTDDVQVTLASGEKVKADVLVGADGQFGKSRATVRGSSRENTTPTGVVMYDTAVEARDLIPEFKEFLQKHGNTIFSAFGNGRAVVAYPVRKGEVFAFQFYAPDDGKGGAYGDGHTPNVSKLITHGEPRLQRVVDHLQWGRSVQVLQFEELTDWVDESDRLVVIGQAAHPFPPGTIQGCAMSVEDGAVLAKLFSHLSHIDQIGPFLNAFQDLRYRRANENRQGEMLNITILTLQDGEMQTARDNGMRAKTAAGQGVFEGGEAEITTRWREIETVFGYDCEDAADDWWVEWGLLRERARAEGQQGESGVGGSFVSFAMSIRVSESIDP